MTPPPPLPRLPRRTGPLALGALGALAAVHAPPPLALVADVADVAPSPVAAPVGAPVGAIGVRYVERAGRWYPIRRRGVYVSEFLQAGALILYAVKSDGELGLWKRVTDAQTVDEVAAELWAALDASDPVAALV